jgi:hypothetical protein
MTIDEMKNRLEDYGYVFSHGKWSLKLSAGDGVKSGLLYDILSSPRDTIKRDIHSSEMHKLLEAEEQIRLRSERIEKVLGYDNQ